MIGIIFQEYLKELDFHVGRPIVLLLNNASSHIWDNLMLRNIKVIPFPPNTTSKLQPLDAGIIAAFKHHYRRKQIAWGLDQLNDGRNPYSIDQLQAMRWSVGAWNSLDESVFANCWRHTGFTRENITEPFSEPESMQVPVDIDNEFVEDYQQFIQQARIENPMSIENFLDPIDEDDEIQVEMTDEEIVELIKGSLEAGSTESDSRSDIEDGDNEPSLFLSLSVREQVSVFAHAIALVEDSSSPWWRDEKEKTIEKLRLMQRDCRRQLREQESRPQLIQRSIAGYFSQPRQKGSN